MLKRLEALSRWISYVEQAILVLCLTIMILFAFAQVLLRFLPNEWSVTWLEPFARQLVLWVGLIGASFATAEGRHISIEALPKLLNAKQKKWLGVFLQLAAAGLAVSLGLLAWTWLVDIDRKEVSDAQIIAKTLEEKAEQYKGQERSKIVESIKKDVEKRINTMRLEGFARLIRFRKVTALTLSSLDDSEGPFVGPAKALLKGDKSLDLEGKDLKALAAPETVETIAGKFDEAAAAYAKGDDALTKKAFEESPVDEDIVIASKDPISEALYEMIRQIEKKPDQDPSTLLQEKAKQTLTMADQKAFMELAGIHVHEWWFHVIVPLALFIMAFRFLINSFAALILSPEEYEARAETLQKDIEAFEAGKEDKQEPPAPETKPEEPAPAPPSNEPIPEALPAAKFDPDSEAPPGALETVDLPPREGLFEEVDKAPPPRSRSGLVPKQTDENEDEELTASEVLGSDSTELSEPDTSVTQPLEKPDTGDAASDEQGDGKKGEGA